LSLKGATLGVYQHHGGLPLATPGRVDDLPDIGGPSSLTDAQLAEFRENGFLAMDRLASEGDVEYIRGVIERLFNRRAGHDEGAHFNFSGDDDDPDAPQFPQILVPCNYEDGLRKTGLFRQASDIARQILGRKALFVGDHTLNKPALNGPETPWHQDEAFRDPNFDYDEISIWVPLQSVGEANGCMQFIPGTHRAELLPHRSPNGDRRAHALECCGGFDVRDAVSCPLLAGGCTIHTGRTLHATGPNHSSASRLAYVLNFSVPPRPAAMARTFPWLEEKETARMERNREWMRRGGVFVKTWRLIKRTEPKDYAKMVTGIMRKAAARRKKL